MAASVPNVRVLVDTNVVIYTHDPGDPAKHQHPACCGRLKPRPRVPQVTPPRLSPESATADFVPL